METASCFINLGGDKLNQVFLESITPAEYLVLATLHGGHDAVESLQVNGKDERDESTVLAELRAKYDRRPEVLKSLFPGFASNLPKAFSAVLPRGGEGGAPLPVHLAEADVPAAGESSDILG